MPAKDSVVKTARMSAETWGEVERIMVENGLTFSGVIRYLIGVNGGQSSMGVPQNEGKEGVPCEYGRLDAAIMADLDQMARLTGGTLEGLLESLCKCLNGGEINLVGGEIVADSHEVNLKGLEQACFEKNVSVQGAIDKATQMVYRSQI